MEKLKYKIRKVISNYLHCENSDLHEQTLLRELNLDDLDFLELKMRLEKLFSVKIEESAFLEKKNLKEINMLLDRLLKY